jgi:hypothetical protein
MNATVECFRHMPELRAALGRVRGGTSAGNFVVAFREMLNAVDRYMNIHNSRDSPF